ncbi:MAG: DUF2334 domain-containing protein [Piscinibacter sp.]|nr:DUF2334 domain-containing protein [Piscinibacter sp.]
MTARFLVRLDDACATMRAPIWQPLEQALDEMGIRPIVGVIPDNRDPTLACSPPDPDFWNRVRSWQAKGWSVAMHGHHHLYHPIPAGARALLDMSDKSEFVGRSLEKQRESLREAYKTMLAQGVTPGLFMAPSHTFDAGTLQALRDVTGIRVVTDGHALRVFEKDGFTWIPQQLWRFARMPFGLWCVCLHPNTMTEAALRAFVDDLKRFAHRVTDVPTVLRDVGPRSALDLAFSLAYPMALQLKRRLRRV